MNSITKWDIIGFGAIAVDDLLYVSHFPRPNSKIEVLKRERQGGGLAGTALVAASRLGSKAAFFGLLGNNDLSEYTISEFAKEGVDTSLCPRNNTAQPIYSSIIVDRSTSERTILYSLENFTHPDPSQIPANLPQKCRLIFLDTYFLPILDYLIEISHANKTPVIADIESIAVLNYPIALGSIDYLILGRELAAQITNKKSPADILQSLDSPNRICTVITEGENGCWFLEKSGEIQYMPAFKVDVVDTTGCGDVFHGAFATALIQGETNTTAVIQASAAAAIKATIPGGRAGIPDRSGLLEFIRKNPDIFPQRID